nr:ATP-dependent helicase [Anaerolineae bacterium]
SQFDVVAYERGKMGVSAVPGSGKTFTLSHLAAKLVDRLAETNRIDDQEVLIVTFTNPAVNTFRNRIGRLVEHERGLLPHVGYRVRTLHGLAHDIVRERPGLVGLAEGFEILDERITTAIIRELSEHWMRNSVDDLMSYLDLLEMGDGPDQIRYRLRKDGPELAQSLASEAIRIAKDKRWTPDLMLRQLSGSEEQFPLARMAVNLYADYQRALSYRGAVDFDDLIRLAMEALDIDPDYLSRLQHRWPYILEDEAQDSSKLQNEMLDRLSGGQNWVRVGDPNQAIYTTFTTADSNFLRAFLREEDVSSRPLPVSGRSTPDIIALANELIDWSQQEPLIKHLANTFHPLHIEPTAPDDPQPNPDAGFIHLDWDPEKNITPEKEIERVVISLERWLPDHRNWTVAILAPENSHGFRVVEELKKRRIAYEELLRSTTATRDAAEKLYGVLQFLANPTSSRLLSHLYSEVWWPLATGNPEDEASLQTLSQMTQTLRKLPTTENFLWPSPEIGEPIPEEDLHLAGPFREQVKIWLQASILPIDQLVLTLSQYLFTEQSNLALGHKIAVVLGSIASNNPDFRLPEFASELRAIAQNERRFLGFDDATEGYEPQPGVVTVATMHAAKGLEWDRVYLLSVNTYSFPAALPGDSYIAEKWFLRDNLNLPAEARAQIEHVMGDTDDYVEGQASKEARVHYAMERLRLLYVGITRAKKDLIITWNMGRFWDKGRQNQGAAALRHLTDFWKREILQHE